MEFPEAIRHNAMIGSFAKLVWYELCVMAYLYSHVTTTAAHIAAMFEVNDQTAYRALNQLEAARLIEIERFHNYKIVHINKNIKS
jgi:predicted DNA-binding transcriptional regulator YafY